MVFPIGLIGINYGLVDVFIGKKAYTRVGHREEDLICSSLNGDDGAHTLAQHFVPNTGPSWHAD